MPCTRFRKLGSHDHIAETTISCAEPPMQTQSIVRERASTLTMCTTASPSDWRLACSAGASSTVR